MTARPVGRCRAETARPTKVRLVEDGAPTGGPLVIGRATTFTVECPSGRSGGCTPPVAPPKGTAPRPDVRQRRPQLISAHGG